MTLQVDTSPAATPGTSPDAPAFRPFAVRVTARRLLSPHFVRVTLQGPDLDELASGGADQRVKLLFPLPGTTRPALPDGADWYAQWRAQPAEQRCPMRTYTVRSARPLERELDVDLVLHGATGPASAWAETCAVGDELLVVGPNARHAGVPGGVEWRPAGARTLLLAGDETAVPAISATVEALPPGTRTRVLLEVPTADDVLPLALPEGVEVTWLARLGQPHGALLHAAVRDAAAGLLAGAADGPADDLDPDGPVWEVPAQPAGPADAYVWLAGEAGVVTRLRRCLLQEVGVPRSAVAFMGYWRQGRTEN